MNNPGSKVLPALAVGAALLFVYQPSRAADGLCDFHLEVKDTFTLAGGWQAFTGIVGSGALKVGEAVRITLPDGTRTVRRVDRIGVRGQQQQSAGPNDIVAVFLADAAGDGLGAAVALDGHCGDAPASAAEARATAAEAAESRAAARDLPREWYAGIRTTTSPDGRQFQGAVEALVERVYDQPNGVITDTVLENGELVTVSLRQGDEPNVFSVHREDGAYTGTVTFAPEAWNATSWTYDLALADGTRIEGTGTDNGEALLIEQYLVGSDGERRTKFTQRLPRIQQSIYEAKRKALVR